MTQPLNTDRAGAYRPRSVQITDPIPEDDLDHYVTDPLVERHAGRRSEKKTAGLLAILDELSQKGLSR